MMCATGIGGQTALKLIRQHGSIENILENINKERFFLSIENYHLLYMQFNLYQSDDITLWNKVYLFLCYDITYLDTLFKCKVLDIYNMMFLFHLWKYL